MAVVNPRAPDPSEQMADVIPLISHEVLDRIASAPDYTEDAAWGVVGDTQTPLARVALVEAERARQAGEDPGDALLAGVRLAITGAFEQVSQNHFVKMFGRTPSTTEPTPPTLVIIRPLDEVRSQPDPLSTRLERGGRFVRLRAAFTVLSLFSK